MSIKLITAYPGAGPAMPHDPIVSAVATVVSAVAGMASKPKVPDNSAYVEQQQKLINQQTAEQTRQQNIANDKTTELDKQLAAQQAAIIQRRSGGGLSFTGPQAQLKTTFGG